MQSFIISEKEKGRRLDVFLKEKLPEFSRIMIQKAIKESCVLVNKEPKKPRYILKEKDQIIARIRKAQEPALIPQKLDIPIIFENNDYLVINKPAGIAAHPSATNRTNTVVNWLLDKYPGIKTVYEKHIKNTEKNENKLRPGIVHRLDKDTSGLMIIAKNKKTLRYFKKLFQERRIIKKYIALVYGTLKHDKGIIDMPIARSKRDPTRQKAVSKKHDHLKTKSAITHYRILKRFKDFTLIEVTPKTGRMHQIRVHFTAIGHPVAGDKKYGFIKKNKYRHPPRQFLHAHFLKFSSPNGRSKIIKVSIPQDIKEFLQEIAKVRF